MFLTIGQLCSILTKNAGGVGVSFVKLELRFLNQRFDDLGSLHRFFWSLEREKKKTPLKNKVAYSEEGVRGFEVVHTSFTGFPLLRGLALPWSGPTP